MNGFHRRGSPLLLLPRKCGKDFQKMVDDGKNFEEKKNLTRSSYTPYDDRNSNNVV